MKSESLRLIAKLELALEGSGFGIWELDLQTGRLIWDERMHKIYGYEPGAFHGDPEEWKSRLHEQDRVLVDRRFQDLIEGKRVELFEFRIINKLTGEIRTLEANGIMQLGLDGKPARVVGMNRDVSDRKHLAESLEYERAARVTASKLASLGEMAGNIAHEINNPLAIIGISTQKLKMICLREGKSTEEIDKTLETINQTVHRMSKIVSGMLRVSRESSEESCEDLDLNVLVDETISICMEKIKKNSIDLIWQKSESPVMITGAPIQISQVLLNLISNSIDALESLGEKWIRIELQPSVSDGFVSLIVTDSGDGIAEDLQEKIMKPFYTSKPVGKGTGLGLTISRTLIEVMGGRLIYNPQSKNTQFRVDLPTVKK